MTSSLILLARSSVMVTSESFPFSRYVLLVGTLNKGLTTVYDIPEKQPFAVILRLRLFIQAKSPLKPRPRATGKLSVIRLGKGGTLQKNRNKKLCWENEVCFKAYCCLQG